MSFINSSELAASIEAQREQIRICNEQIDREEIELEEEIGRLRNSRLAELVEQRNVLAERTRDLALRLASNEALENTRKNIELALSEVEPVLTNGELVYREMKNIIITAPTQIGKTGEIINIIKNEKFKKSLNVISCDNRKDQLEQITVRFVKAGINILSVEDNTAKKGISKKFKKLLIGNFLANNGSINIILLNNDAQCKKMNEIVNFLLSSNDYKFERHQVIHDEADMVNKSGNITTIIPEERVAKVHAEWIKHFNSVKLFKDIKFHKRIHISATPENCALIHGVIAKNVFVISANPDYRPQNKYFEWDGNFIKVSREVERIKRAGSKEIILYCSNNANETHTIAARTLVSNNNCPVLTYNSKGIWIYRHDTINPMEFQGTISEAIAFIEVDYDGPAIIVGYNLMNRGISFVSNRIGPKPLTATVMFYTGSDTICTVSVAQRIGRITGTSRPDIRNRRIYCNKKIHLAYTNYIENQEKIYSELSNPNNAERLVSEILGTEDLNLKKLGRDLERKIGTVNENYDSACSISSETSSSSDEMLVFDENKMKRLIKRWSRAGNNDAVARLFRKIVSKDDKRLANSSVLELISNPGAYSILVTPGRGYDFIFKRDSNYHYITDDALAYYNTIN